MISAMLKMRTKSWNLVIMSGQLILMNELSVWMVPCKGSAQALICAQYFKSS